MKNDTNILEIIGIFTVIFLGCYFIYIQFSKAECVKKGWSSADITGCYDIIGNTRIRIK
jgi:hypothetical protein